MSAACAVGDQLPRTMAIRNAKVAVYWHAEKVPAWEAEQFCMLWDNQMVYRNKCIHSPAIAKMYSAISMK